MPARLRRAPSLAELASEVAVAELAVEVALRREDRDSGFVPANARRARFPHEVAAGVNFAAAEQVVDDAAARMLARVELATARVGEALEAHLRTLPTGRAMIEYLANLNDPARRVDWPGYREAIADLPTEVAAELRRVVDDGALAVLGEARAQGVPAAALGDLGDLTDDQRRRLDLGRDRVANIPGNRVRELAGRFVHDFPVFNFEHDPESFLRIMRANVVDVPSGLAGSAVRSEAQQAHGVGRQRGAAGVARPARIYASELLDRSTCGPCSLVDGREFPTEAAARIDYPHGVYRNCEGGARCRGTLVFVWETEEPPTEEGPGNLPPAPTGRGGRPGDPILDLGGQGGAARLELSRRALRDVYGVELVDGQRVRITGGTVHRRPVVAGTLEQRAGRLLFVEDGIGDDPGPLLDILDGYLARIPPELGTGGLDLLALSNNDYDLPSAIGGTTAATSSGDTIVFWRGFGHRSNASDGELFDHELGHSSMHHWNDTLGPAARRTDAGDLTNPNDPAWRLGRAGSDPGDAWAAAMESDRARALAAEERLSKLWQKVARERPELVGTDGFLAEVERRIGRMRGDNRAAMATIRTRFREVDRPPGSFAARPSGVGTYDGVSRAGVSDYGSSKPVEDWAEAFRLYLRARRNGKLGQIEGTYADVSFADLYPARAELLDALFAGGRTYHRRLGAGAGDT